MKSSVYNSSFPLRIAAQIAELKFNMAGIPGAPALLDILLELSGRANSESSIPARKAMLEENAFPGSSVYQPASLELEDGRKIQGVLQIVEEAHAKVWSDKTGIERIPISLLPKELRAEIPPEIVTSDGTILGEVARMASVILEAVASTSPEDCEQMNGILADLERQAIQAERVLFENASLRSILHRRASL